jgi:small subunit ribosomal protein S12
MPTYNQLCKNKRRTKKKISGTPALGGCPQKKGVCVKLVLRAPRKPNSALRKLAKINLSNDRRVYGYIPGEGHNVKEFSSVLIRGGRVPDLPGVKYNLIRGKFDLGGVKDRISSKSKYGIKSLRKYV